MHAEMGQWGAALDSITRMGQRLAAELETQQLMGVHTGSLPHNHGVHPSPHLHSAEEVHVMLDRINQRFQDLNMRYARKLAGSVD